MPQQALNKNQSTESGFKKKMFDSVENRQHNPKQSSFVLIFLINVFVLLGNLT